MRLVFLGPSLPALLGLLDCLVLSTSLLLLGTTLYLLVLLVLLLFDILKLTRFLLEYLLLPLDFLLELRLDLLLPFLDDGFFEPFRVVQHLVLAQDARHALLSKEAAARILVQQLLLCLDEALVLRQLHLELLPSCPAGLDNG